MKAIIITTPKAGTHLLVTALEKIGLKEKSQGLTGTLVRPQSRNPIRNCLINNRIEKKSHLGISIDLDFPDKKCKKKWLVKFLNEVPNKHFITSHIPYSKEIKNLLIENGFKIFIVTRDPRDMIVSMANSKLIYKNNAHLRLKSLDFEGRCKFCIDGFLDGSQSQVNPLHERLKHTINWKNDEDVFSVSFEELIGKNGGGNKESQLLQLKMIANYLELEYEENMLKNISEKVYNTKSETFVNGKIGLWKKLLPKEITMGLNPLLLLQIKELGYDV